MGTFYISPLTGSDANTGTSWAQAWKTINTGATAARIVPGDIIRIAKSPNPVPIGNASWTKLSKTITLASALTANIDTCSSPWTAVDANVSAVTESTIVKEGSTSMKIALLAAFTTGKIAYFTIPSTNFSAYQQISFWFRTSVALTANMMKICLCSDTLGNTIVDEFVIPVTISTGVFIPYTLNKGSALGSAIQSVALYAISDPGTPTMYIDNILAVKSASVDDALSLTSLISKNSNATGGDEGWYGIQSINGTTVILDNDPSTSATSSSAGGRGYYGTTETVTTYRREPFRCAAITECTVTDSGTEGNLIQYQGGYEYGTTDQNGETFFDFGGGAAGSGLLIANAAYNQLNRINVVRAQYGLAITGASSKGNTVTAHTFGNCLLHGVFLSTSISNTVTAKNSINNTSAGLWLIGTTTGCGGNVVNIRNISNNLLTGITLTTLSNFNSVDAAQVCNNGTVGVAVINSYDNNIRALLVESCGTYGLSFSTDSSRNKVQLTTNLNASGAVSTADASRNFLKNSTLNETTKVTGLTNYYNGRISSTAEGNVVTDNVIYTDGGIMRSQVAVRHTASGMAWELAPSSTIRSVSYPLELSIAKIAVGANSQVTAAVWMRRSNTGITGKLVCKGWQLAGIDSDVVSSISAAADTWQQLTIQFTPVEAGVVELVVQAYGGTTYSVYIDDITLIQE